MNRPERSVTGKRIRMFLVGFAGIGRDKVGQSAMERSVLQVMCAVVRGQGGAASATPAALRTRGRACLGIARHMPAFCAPSPRHTPHHGPESRREGVSGGENCALAQDHAPASRFLRGGHSDQAATGTTSRSPRPWCTWDRRSCRGGPCRTGSASCRRPTGRSRSP